MQLARLKLGEYVVIRRGRVGVYATAVAKEMGAGRVVIDSIRERLELARGFGADEVIDIEGSRIRSAHQARHGADRQLGSGHRGRAGRSSARMQRGLAMVGRTGRYLEISNISGLAVRARPVDLIFGNRSILGIVYYEASITSARPDAADARPLSLAEGGQPYVSIDACGVREADQGRVTERQSSRRQVVVSTAKAPSAVFVPPASQASWPALARSFVRHATILPQWGVKHARPFPATSGPAVRLTVPGAPLSSHLPNLSTQTQTRIPRCSRVCEVPPSRVLAARRPETGAPGR
jgi:hypothetical protein